MAASESETHIPEGQPAAPDTNAQTLALLSTTAPEQSAPPYTGGVDGVLFSDGDASFRKNDDHIYGEVSVYVVREGDTLSQIAKMYDVSANTILWANDLPSANRIKPGMTLSILPISGVRHTVTKGDTVKSLAKKYNGDESEIIAYNQLETETLTVGSVVVIPNGVIEAQRTTTAPTGVSVSGTRSAGFIHPLPNGRKTQGIHGYNGIDIGAPIGSLIRAAAAGTVIISKPSGYNGGYGQYVVIRHPNGVQTLYAHMSQNMVAVGDVVTQGQTIGAVGNTGRSTGPHLHFEVRGAVNPF